MNLDRRLGQLERSLSDYGQCSACAEEPRVLILWDGDPAAAVAPCGVCGAAPLVIEVVYDDMPHAEDGRGWPWQG